MADDDEWTTMCGGWGAGYRLVSLVGHGFLLGHHLKSVVVWLRGDGGG
jgi:hypothetical protein